MELGPVESGEFLGFVIDHIRRIISYKLIPQSACEGFFVKKQPL